MINRLISALVTSAITENQHSPAAELSYLSPQSANEQIVHVWWRCWRVLKAARVVKWHIWSILSSLQVWSHNVFRVVRTFDRCLGHIIVWIRLKKSAVCVNIVNDTALSHYTLELSTSSTPPITSPGPSWLTEPSEWPCVFAFVYVCVDSTHAQTHTWVCVCVYVCTKICMCPCVWLVDSWFQLKLYAKRILLHKQDMHLVVSTQILQRPFECVTLSHSQTGPSGSLDWNSTRNWKHQYIAPARLTYVCCHYHHNFLHTERD